MKVSDIMTKDVLYFYEDESIFDAITQMTEKNISGAPVLNRKGELVGIISTTDIVEFLNIELDLKPKNMRSVWSLILYSLKKLAEIEKIKHVKDLMKMTKVKDLMSKDVYAISPNTTILEAAEMMNEKDVSRLPVIDNGKLVGIVTKGDIVRYILKL